jgi:hypothetical protein
MTTRTGREKKNNWGRIDTNITIVKKIQQMAIKSSNEKRKRKTIDLLPPQKKGNGLE